jgi:hypothetical protein
VSKFNLNNFTISWIHSLCHCIPTLLPNLKRFWHYPGSLPREPVQSRKNCNETGKKLVMLGFSVNILPIFFLNRMKPVEFKERIWQGGVPGCSSARQAHNEERSSPMASETMKIHEYVFADEPSSA